jgi:VWFA-related protein
VAFAQQSVPDAPSATRPSNPFPAGTKPAPIEQPNRPAEAAQEPTPPVTPPPTQPPAPDTQGLPVFTTGAIEVKVPVTVKDSEGRQVLGLLAKDFEVRENGQPQTVKFFSSEAVPLTAAVVIDQGMAQKSMRKVNSSLQTLAAAFAAYDEVALYTYSNVVNARANWQAVGNDFSAALQRARTSGRTGGVPVTGGPMAAGPTVNGRPFDPGATTVNIPRTESHVLNDAILRAANDLAQRDPEGKRRKIIFLISDGQEDGSTASYADVLKLLLTQNIAVYALGVDSAAIPVYQKLAQVRIPQFGTGNILPKYVSATGGQLMTEFGRDEIERAYADLASQARNQYTLIYQAKVTPPTYRSIEVLVNRPGLRVYARDGYYPLPPRR